MCFFRLILGHKTPSEWNFFWTTCMEGQEERERQKEEGLMHHTSSVPRVRVSWKTDYIHWIVEFGDFWLSSANHDLMHGNMPLRNITISIGCVNETISRASPTPSEDVNFDIHLKQSYLEDSHRDFIWFHVLCTFKALKIPGPWISPKTCFITRRFWSKMYIDVHVTGETMEGMSMLSSVWNIPLLRNAVVSLEMDATKNMNMNNDILCVLIPSFYIGIAIDKAAGWKPMPPTVISSHLLNASCTWYSLVKWTTNPRICRTRKAGVQGLKMLQGD